MLLYDAKEARYIAHEALNNESIVLQRVWGDIDKEAKEGHYSVNVVVPVAFVEFVTWKLKKSGFKVETSHEDSKNCQFTISWDEQ